MVTQSSPAPGLGPPAGRAPRPATDPVNGDGAAAGSAGSSGGTVAYTVAPRVSRAQRLAQPVTVQALTAMAVEHGVCVRPLAMRRTDLVTGQTEVFDLPCGATREAKCAPCAKRARRLRQVQCREGWHRDDEPLPPPEATPEQVAMLSLRADFEYLRADSLNRAAWAHVAELDDAIAELEALMTASGLRGTVKPDPTPVPSWAIPAGTVTAADVTTVDVSTVDGAQNGDGDGDATEDGRQVGADGGAGGLVDGDTGASGAGGEGTGDGDGAAGAAGGGGSSAAGDSGGGRRVRSTRRRQDSPDLPRQPVSARTVGRTFAGNAGRVFRPSTFVTLTLPSYGRVGPDGAPVNPATYDYRRAAWDAVHFPALLDRLWQNLRRAEGWNVQYFGAVEPQRRLAPHAHFAVRGAIPRVVIRRVIEATYHQVWWPSTATVVYPDHAPQPFWDSKKGAYLDPDTGAALPTWDQALDVLDGELDADPHRGPEHVVQFGSQLDLQGVLAGTDRAAKMIGYLTKYLTKSVSECHQVSTAEAVEHQRRLWQELRHTPCTPRCANWLRYGIQPKGARAKLTAGSCRAKVHQLDTLGIGGRRVLVSRQWSGKTLADHRYDQAVWVRNLLAHSLKITDEVDGETAAKIDAAREGGAPAPVAWELARPGDPGVPDLTRRLMRSIAARIRHRAVIDAASRADPPGGEGSSTVSATGGGGVDVGPG